MTLPMGFIAHNYTLEQHGQVWGYVRFEKFSKYFNGLKNDMKKLASDSNLSKNKRLSFVFSCLRSMSKDELENIVENIGGFIQASSIFTACYTSKGDNYKKKCRYYFHKIKFLSEKIHDIFFYSNIIDDDSIERLAGYLICAYDNIDNFLSRCDLYLNNDKIVRRRILKQR